MTRPQQRLPQGFTYPASVHFLKAALSEFRPLLHFALDGISRTETSLNSTYREYPEARFDLGSVKAFRHDDSSWHFNVSLRGIRDSRLASHEDAFRTIIVNDIRTFAQRVLSMPVTDPRSSREPLLFLGFQRYSGEAGVSTASWTQ